MRGRPRPRWVGVAALGVFAALVVVLGVAQLVLPGIAARRLRDTLARSGQVESVTVSAFPAIELLWHHADRVTIRMRSYTASSASLGGSLGRIGDVGSLSATAAVARIGLLTVQAVRLTVAHGRVLGLGTIEESDLRAAIPFLQSVEPVASSGGTLVLRGTASLLGVLGASVDVTVRAVGGALVATPDVPLGGLASLRLFSLPGVAVTGVQATRLGAGLAMVVSGRVR